MTQQFNRRRALGAFGTISLGTLLSACGTGRDNAAVTSATRFEGAATCTLTPEQIEGPYYFDARMIRGDIREDRPGTPLRLAIRVRDAQDCAPIANAVVDVWHCDAGGIYSGFEAASRAAQGAGLAGVQAGSTDGDAAQGAGPASVQTGRTDGDAAQGTGLAGVQAGSTDGDAAQGAGPASVQTGRTDGETYLRGAQVSNADGVAEFTTVYPGWYTGRTVHIHARAHLDATSLVTTQLYFDDAVTGQVHAQAPYSQRTGRDTFNDNDGFIDSGGGTPTLTLSQDGDGWLGLITIGVDRT
ncbi:MAG: protocatechuate dioxygenase [Egibacteraceae bacterium]